jgi:hypothetical protein
MPRPGFPYLLSRPDLTEYDPKVWRLYWSVPMESAGVLWVPNAVAQLVATGGYRQAAGVIA